MKKNLFFVLSVVRTKMSVNVVIAKLLKFFKETVKTVKT